MDYSSVITQVKPSVALISVTRKDANGQDVSTYGSGFAYRENGKLATCNHVVQDATKIQIRFAASTTVIDAVIHNQDVVHDLAILNFTAPTGAQPAPLIMPTPLTVVEGQAALFCGFPIYGSLFMTHHAMISAIETDQLGNTVYVVDGSNNKGNSGGPLLDTGGNVIGVMSNLAHNDGDKLLENVYKLQTGAISIFGSDLVAIHKRLIDNIQLGVGVARPANYLDAIVT